VSKTVTKTVRYIAFTLLERVDKGGAYSNIAIKEAIATTQLNEKDARLLTELVYGTIGNQLRLDYYLAPFLKKAKKVDKWVKVLLRMSIYQLHFLDKVPSHAIFNEAVEIAKYRGNVGVGQFVNGVLRQLQRVGVRDVEQIAEPMERVSITYSLPMWLVQALVKQIGLAATAELGASLMKPSHVSARVDTRVCTMQEALDSLAAEGITAQPSAISPVGLVGEKGFLAGSELFTRGQLTIQDESSMLVAPMLAIEPGDKVLDACAAPGGKTTHIATYLDAEKGGEVRALDIHPHKVALIEENATRLHVETVVHAQQLDARKVSEVFAPETFDRILVDAPCSGIGLIRRKPDIKYQKTPQDFTNLPKIQLSILESVAPTLKSGGRMVYSTCTIMEEENEQVVAAFLAKHPEFELVEPVVSESVRGAIKDHMLTIYPQAFHTDGFFISCLQKK